MWIAVDEKVAFQESVDTNFYQPFLLIGKLMFYRLPAENISHSWEVNFPIVKQGSQQIALHGKELKMFTVLKFGELN